MTPRLRLAYFADPLELAAQRWAGFFYARGHEVVFIIPHDRPAPPDSHGAIPVVRLRPPSRRRRPARWVDLSFRLREAVRTINPHIVHAHYLTSQGPLAWASGFRPYVVTVWGSDVFVDLRRPKARMFGRVALRGAAMVTANSRHIGAAAIRAGARPSRVVYVQFGVDTSEFAPQDADDLRARIVPDGGRIILSPRTIMPIYRHHLLVRALAELPPDVHLVMTARGAVQSTLDALRVEAERLNVLNRLIIVPGIEHVDMPRFLNAADVVASVPLSDGTPVSVLEAMACGRPTVVGDLPTMRELRSGLRDDLIVRDPDGPELAGALQRALALNSEARRELATRGRALVIERGNYEQNMLMVEERYLSLAGLT